MASWAVPLAGLQPVSERVERWPRVIRYPHPPESMAGAPYYDDELDMAQSLAHSKTIRQLAGLLDRVAAAAGLKDLSDNPVWYWIPEEGRQKILYPDYALTADPDLGTLTAMELLLAVEVVTTSRRDKEYKDTVRMRDYNAAHGVREFVLIYPELDDERSVVWHRYEGRGRRYRVVPLPANRRYRSVAIPGLEVEVLPREAWQVGCKVRVWFQGEEFRDAAVEAARAEQEAVGRRAAEQQATQEAVGRRAAEQQAAQEAAGRQAAEQRVAQLAERLRALGLDPD